MKCQLRTRAESADKSVVEGWGTLTWLASREITQSEITVGRVVIKPGESNPRHCHDRCEEVLFLIEGRLDHTFGDDVTSMEAGDTLVVPPGLMHSARNTGDADAVMIVAYSSGQRDFRTEG